ncbi:MAG: PHP domain-containing protein [Turicibacter sp.]|nr:PHP domain-containing protein [Turicibacter sp.]
MKIYYDLHIHSVLSPCADDLMTPNHIVLMAKLKGLDVIALTDHNSTRNCRVVSELAKEAGLLFIPGIEVETIEGVHLLSYFETIDLAETFGAWIESHLALIKNDTQLFGHQWVMDEKDEVIEEFEWLLIQSTDLTCEEVVLKTHQLGGFVIAAHLNKLSHNILTHLGFIPDRLNLDGIELNSFIYEAKNGNQDILASEELTLFNSDAHSLGYINEPIYFLEIKKDIHAIFQYLRKGSDVK